MRAPNRLSFFVGIMLSFVGHLLALVVLIVVFERRDAKALRRVEVFSVTLEGGESLGGISQAPVRENKKKVLPAVAKTTESAEPVSRVEEKTVVKKEIERPTVVEDPEKLRAEKEKKKKLQEAKQRKVREDKKKKLEADKKRKKQQALKRKVEAERKKKALARRKQLEAKKRKRERDSRINRAIEAASDRYDGESANAGGRGFGAAKLGGRGMGGGRLESVAFIAYSNQLEAHIKRGWRWLRGRDVLNAQVLVVMLPSGVVQDVRIIRSSGHGGFDESVLRAVYKASPVPAPPASLRDRFREVRITFDSHE